MKLLWFIPTYGDSRYIGSSIGARDTSYDYLKQVAQAVDHLGYYGALLPTGRTCEDAWVIASALATETKNMKFLVAVRPGLTLPSVSARMAATLDRISNGRLLVNVVAGGDPVELASDGIFHTHDERYTITDEFLDIWRKLSMEEDQFSYEGNHYKVENSNLFLKSKQRPYPELYFGGSSSAGQAVAVNHADVYLTWGEPPAQVAEKINQMKTLAKNHGRTLRFGIRLHVVVRETEAEAWQVAHDLIKHVTEESIQAALQVFKRFDSEGQKRMTQLHQGRKDQLEISPNLWAGIGLLRGGAGTAIVGSPEIVAARIKEYQDLGIEEFIFSGYPHLEEAYRFAELVFPLLNYPPKADKKEIHTPYVSPFGEIKAAVDRN
ncbi:FMNH2-dependent alkanesulfonate monooxygenase [Sphingobacterium chungjuense]|uniref:FMNH2-dependent alkanesulfonate monooxygenase n=1 Tax=Sphingobacterium chungjuense TaxID=2675553 RepID=UPI00140AFD60|nr:FMNH2-dependent alkanesulfonate monooxygenase [Sphingobacterium chungjuense]